MTQLKPSIQTACTTLFALVAVTLAGCSVLATRPVQEMSDTAAALRAAREVQADTLAPDLYRRSNEWFSKARHEYKFKNFQNAKDYADKARRYAEQAEFEAIKNNGVRADASNSDSAPPPPPEPKYDYPTPTGTPVDVYDQHQREEEAKKKSDTTDGTVSVPAPNQLPPTAQ